MAERTQGGWRTFTIGLGVRLVGVALIWLGDGSERLGRKALVVLGVILSVGGIAVLRYMLFAPLLAKLGRRRPNDNAAPPVDSLS